MEGLFSPREESCSVSQRPGHLGIPKRQVQDVCNRKIHEPFVRLSLQEAVPSAAAGVSAVGSAMCEEGQCLSLGNLVLDPELSCATLTYLGNLPVPHFLQLEMKAVKLDESSRPSISAISLSLHLKLKFKCGKSE